MTLSASHELTADAAQPRLGRVVLLNGTSSSGKTALAEAFLVAAAAEPWYHLGVDAFHRMRSRGGWDDGAFLPVFQRTVLGFHRAVAGMAHAGNDVVVDHVLGEDWRLADLRDVLVGLPVLFVALHCSLPELERRERERGDRTIGRAALQYPLVHRHGRYDVEVDTEHDPPSACAAQVRRRLQQGPGTALADTGQVQDPPQGRSAEL